MNAVTRLSSKGQVVIPKGVREALGWAEGQEIAIERAGDRLFLKAAGPSRSKIGWDEFERRVPVRHLGQPVTVEAMDAAIEAMWRTRAGAGE